MTRLNTLRPSRTEADLRELVEPLACYISADTRPRAALILALALLASALREIDDDANACITAFGEKSRPLTPARIGSAARPTEGTRAAGESQTGEIG